MPDCTLLDLPYMCWFRILNFLTSFDIINLYFSSKTFTKIIFSTKYSSVFKPMDRVWNKKIWVDILSRTFSDFINRIRDELKDDLEVYFYLGYRFHSFIFNNLSLYSVLHILLCVKEDVTKRNLMNVFVIFVPELLHKFSIKNIILIL